MWKQLCPEGRKSLYGFKFLVSCACLFWLYLHISTSPCQSKFLVDEGRRQLSAGPLQVNYTEPHKSLVLVTRTVKAKNAI